jgi:UPF0755 protein
MKLVRLLLVLLILSVIAAGLAVLSVFYPYAGFKNEKFIDIRRGTSSSGVAALLADAKVIRYSWQFLLVRALRSNARLQAGEYRFHTTASTWEVFDRLVRGDVYYYELTVPEGYNLYDIAASIDQLGFISGEEFLHVARDPSLIRDLAPEAPTLEGYLFPDTYRITRHTTASQLCHLMTDRFRKAWKQLETSAPVHTTVTLASLVERETRVEKERPLVASVFLNRLRLNMSLDCDPTAIYAALQENRYQGVLNRSDLRSKNVYNTYERAGLPPGPIANPGIESLRAVLYPADTDFLYFVARPDGSGEHQFSKSLDAHQRAVQRYRRTNHRTRQGSSSPSTPD